MFLRTRMSVYVNAYIHPCMQTHGPSPSCSLALSLSLSESPSLPPFSLSLSLSREFPYSQARPLARTSCLVDEDRETLWPRQAGTCAG